MGRNGKTDRNRIASSVTNLESDIANAPLGADEAPAPDSPVRVIIVSVRKRLADPDGISGKAAIDGLVACGLLSDDTTQQVESVSFQQVKGRVESTKIVLDFD